MVAEILPPSPTSTSNTNIQQNELTSSVPDAGESNAESSDNGGIVSVPATPDPLRQHQARSPLLTTMMELPTTANARHSPSTTNHRGIQIDTDDEEQPGVVVVEEEIPSGDDAPPLSTTPIPTAVAANTTDTTTTTTSYAVPTPFESDRTATEHSHRGRTNVARAPHQPGATPSHRGAAVIPTSPISMMHPNAASHPNAFVHPSVVTRTTTPHHHQSILLNSPTSPLPTPMSSYTSNPVNHRCINPASGRVRFCVFHLNLLITYHRTNCFISS
jgi:hypothetical protein